MHAVSTSGIAGTVLFNADGQYVLQLFVNQVVTS